MIASLRRCQRASAVTLAVLLPIGLAWAVTGRAAVVVTERATLPLAPLLTTDELAAPRVAGDHLGTSIGPLAVEVDASGGATVFVVTPPASSAGEVLLFACATEPTVKRDLPAGARLLGPFQSDGAPTRQRIDDREAEPWVAAYSLPLATVVARYRLDRAEER